MFDPLCAESHLLGLVRENSICAVCAASPSAVAFVSPSGTKRGPQSLCRAGDVQAMSGLVVPRTLFRVRNSRKQGEGRQQGKHFRIQAAWLGFQNQCVAIKFVQPSTVFSFLLVNITPKIIKSSQFTVIVDKISTQRLQLY